MSPVRPQAFRIEDNELGDITRLFSVSLEAVEDPLMPAAEEPYPWGSLQP